MEKSIKSFIIHPCVVLQLLTLSCCLNPSIEKKIPAFTAETIEGANFNSEEIKFNQYTLLLFFDPLCEQCQEEIEQLLSVVSQTDKIQLYCLTLASYDLVLPFNDNLVKKAINNTTILLLKEPSLYIYYGISSPPACFLYSKDKFISGSYGKNDFEKVLISIQSVINANSMNSY